MAEPFGPKLNGISDVRGGGVTSYAGICTTLELAYPNDVNQPRTGGEVRPPPLVTGCRGGRLLDGDGGRRRYTYRLA